MEKNEVGATPTRKTTIPRKRGARGSGHAIAIDLHEYADLLIRIREAAKQDDREPSKYLRRLIVLLDKNGQLFPTE